MAYFTFSSASRENYKVGIKRKIIIQRSSYESGGHSPRWYLEEDEITLVDLETLEDLITLSISVGSDLIVSSYPQTRGYTGKDSPWPEPFRGIDGKPIDDIVGSIFVYDGYIE